MKKYSNILIIIILLCSTILQASSPRQLNLGIYAYRPQAVMQEQYQPLVNYLNNYMNAFGESSEITLHILELDEIDQALAKNQLDFLFTNPRHYNILRHKYKFSGVIATLLKQNSNGNATQKLGGVIFTRNTNATITQLKDIKGHRIAVPSTRHMGGYQAQAYELLQTGIHISDDAQIIEVGSHQNVIDFILSGKAEIGFIRTEILENNFQNGNYSRDDFKIINPQKFSHFPFISSTQLYPEWPFIALPQVEPQVVNHIISALLAMNEFDLDSYKTGIAGFIPPADYMSIDTMSRELRLPPHERVTDFTLFDIWHQYKNNVIIIFSLALINAVLLLFLLHRNKLIVKQKRSLGKQARKMHQIIHATQAGTWEWNIQTGKTVFNERWAELIGYTLAELSPLTINTWSKLIHPDDLKTAEENLKHHFSGKTEFYEADFRMKHKGGYWIWLNARGKVTRWSEDGKPLWMSGTHTDISERKEFERQLSHAQRLIEQSLNEIYLFDVSTLYFIDANRSAKNNLGYSMAELLKLTPYDIKPELSREEFLELIKPLQDGTQEELIYTTLHQRKNSSRYPVEVHLQLSKNEQSVYIAMVHDISERQQKQRQLHELNERFSKIASRIPGVIYQFLMRPDGHSCFPYASDKMLDIYQVTPEQVKKDASKAFNTLHPDDYDMVMASLQESARTLQPWKLEYRVQSPDNTIRWLYGDSIPEHDNNGNTLWNGFITDITEKRQAQDQVRLMASVFSNSQEGIIISDKDNRIIDVNPACLEITGYTHEDLMGQSPGIFSSGEQSAEFYHQMWQTLNNSGHWQGEVTNIKKSGERYTERLSISTVLNEKGELQHYVAVFYDITYIKIHEAEMEHHAYHDPLTGLPNRLLLYDRIHKAIEQKQRTEHFFALCYLDLDGFKAVNDNYGHDTGDLILLEVTQRLQSVVRAGDTVSRIGGDEFVLLLLNLDSKEELKAILERILVEVSNLYVLPVAEESTAVPEDSTAKISSISASIGITFYPQDNNEGDILLRHADQAMYIAKQSGKNCYKFFKSE